MDGSSGPMIDGWGWLWQMAPVWSLLLMLVVGLVVFSLVTATPGRETPAAPDTNE
jgi:hypothetical protein